MRPIHTPQSNISLLPIAGIPPYSSMIGNTNRDERLPNVSIQNCQNPPTSTPPVFFMPPQHHNNIMENNANVLHSSSHMYNPIQNISGYMATPVASNTPIPPLSMNQHRNDIRPINMNSDLFSYYPVPQMRTVPEIRSTPVYTGDQVHLPVAQRGPTVYIGHLTPDTDDVIIRQLLQECGRVLRWSRTTDPGTKKLSSFGFCEFESPLGVTRAVRCLNGLILNGQPLVANCEDKVKEGMEKWRNDRKNKLQEENPAKSIQEIEQEIEKEELRTTATTRRIASEWNAKIAAQRVTEETQKQETAPEVTSLAPLVPEAAVEPQRPITEPIVPETLPEKTACVKVSRHQQLLNALPGYVEAPLNQTLSSRESIRIRQWNNIIKDRRANFRKRCQAWEKKEEYLFKDRARNREECEAALKNPSKMFHSQKKRLIDKDICDLLYCITPNGTIWEGPLSSRREEEQMACIEKEIQRDDLDREKEKEEIEAAIQAEKDKKLKEQEEMLEKQIQKEKEEVVALDPVQHVDIDKQDIHAKLSDSPVSNVTKDVTDISISSHTKSMESESPMQAAVIGSEKLIEGLHAPLDLRGISAKKRLPVRDKRVISSVSNVFNLCDDDDDDGEFRTRYKRPLPELTTSLNLAKRPEEAKQSVPENSKELLLQIASQIPQKMEDLFVQEIDWDLLKKHKILDAKVTPWINKKILEFLGEEEPELTFLISTKLSLEPDPSGFLEELKEFFDEDATGFTVKLWKMLLFEVLRLRRSS
ncbi:RNA-binding protein 25-like isoform X2 [Hylaeus volcanicus]|uniref:RNA-binding protein 25-like isoform X2 n=1 Tax=Hylaeus volcanicus TaxID=313075 RepID=UPI0023B7CCFD|nr:RNA-binding protein 25-like isoform X2 [Hylaeus volcanicus]